MLDLPRLGPVCQNNLGNTSPLLEFPMALANMALRGADRVWYRL